MDKKELIDIIEKNKNDFKLNKDIKKSNLDVEIKNTQHYLRFIDFDVFKFTKDEQKIDAVYAKHIKSQKVGLQAIAMERCKIVYLNGISPKKILKNS